MSDYSNYKKADLVNVLKKLEIHTYSKDTKKILIDKLDGYVKNHPLDGEMTIQGLLEVGDHDDDEATLAEGHIKNTDEEDDEEEEDEDDDDDEDDEVEVEVEVEEDEEKDADFESGPPINLKEWIVDPIIDWYERVYSKTLEFTDSIGITTTDYSEELREKLSKTITLAYIELLFEVCYFLYVFLPFVALKDNYLNHQVFKDNIPWLGKSLIPTPDLIKLLDWNIISTFWIWLVSAILLPGIASYFINFSKRVLVFDGEEGIIARIYEFDPFVFSLTKVLIYYFLQGYPAISINVLDGYWHAIRNYLAIKLGIYNNFTNILGNFPVVLGLANVAIALYAQFEDY